MEPQIQRRGANKRIRPGFALLRKPAKYSVFSECYSENDIKGIRTDRYLYYRDMNSDEKGLFDIKSDPTAMSDIADIEIDTATAMDEELKRVIEENEQLKKQFETGTPIDLSPDREAEFRNLGYLD